MSALTHRRGRLGKHAAPPPPVQATGVSLPGTNTNYIKAPDSTGLSVTGDLDLCALVSLDDWTPSAQRSIISKANNTGGQRSYEFIIGTGGANNGNFQFQWYPAGSTATTETSTAQNTITDGTLQWIRVTLEVNVAGVYNVKFYTSPDVAKDPTSGTPPTWTQLGATKVGAASTTVFDGTAAVGLGSHVADTTNGSLLWSGKYVKAIIRAGVNGTVGGYFDATQVSRTGVRTPASMTDAQSNVWTPQGTGWDWTTT